MIRLSAATRISLTLACLCLSLLFAAQTLGLIPDQSKAVLQSRKTFCKAVASQACWAAQKEDIKGLKEETERLMDKNDGVLSVAVLRANGQYLMQVGDHPVAYSVERRGRFRRRPRGNPDLQRAPALGEGANLLSADQRQRLGVVVHGPGSFDPLPDALHVSALAALPEASSSVISTRLPSFPIACVPRSTRWPKAS